MTRFLAFLMASGLPVLLACGGGGGSTTSAPAVPALDGDPNATPPADPAYFKVPSNPLGAIVSGGSVTFNYWNPNASVVTLCLYVDGNDPLSAPAATRAMTRGGGGIWSTGAGTIPSQNFYVYRVGVEYVLDP